MNALKVFSGNANLPLAGDICQALGVPLGEALVSSFRNGETRVKIGEHVRGTDVFVIQPTSAPADHHLMELLLLVDALRRASAARITGVVPYYGYSRQEKKTAGREPISAKLVANLLVTAGVDRLVTLDLHAPAIQGFFDIPVDHLSAIPLLASHLNEQAIGDIIVVSPDSGGVARANEFRHWVGIPGLAVVAKYRPEADVAEVLEMVGHVEGKIAIIVDDIVATGGTLIEAADLVLERGARRAVAYAVHGELSGAAAQLIHASALDHVAVTNSIAVPANKRDSKIEVVNIAGLLAEAIRRIHEGRSVSDLFQPPPVRADVRLQPVG